MQLNSEQLPTVTIVVLNYNGLSHLENCFDSLKQVAYPADKLEIMFVDNGSSDGSETFVRQNYPELTVVQNGLNLGFAEGNNIGARLAKGQIVVFLNNDTKVDRNWLLELARPIIEDHEVVCTAAKILDWDGKTIDFVQGVINFHGFAYQENWRTPVEPGYYEESRPLLFACGGSMAIRRQVFLEAGGFDKDFFVFYEDVDLGWRLWVLGYKVVFAPQAIVYHRHHGTASRVSDYRKTYLYERNALYAIIKNYEEANLNKILPAALFLAIHRATDAISATGFNVESYHPDNWASLTKKKLRQQIPSPTVIPLLAVRDVVANMPRLMDKRAEIQAKRRRSDHEIIQLFGQPLRMHMMGYHLNASYAVAQANLIDTFQIDQIFRSLGKKIVILSPVGLPRFGFPPTAEGLRIETLGEGLARQGHQVLYSMPKALLENHEVPAPVRDIAWDPRKSDRIVIRLSPDILITSCWKTLASVIRGKYRPIVFDGALFYQNYGQHSTRAVKEIRESLEKVDHFVCLWDSQRQELQTNLAKLGLNISLNDIEVIPGMKSDVSPVNVSADTAEVKLACIFDEPATDHDLELLAQIADQLSSLGASPLQLLFSGQTQVDSRLKSSRYGSVVICNDLPSLKESLDQSQGLIALPGEGSAMQIKREIWQIFALGRGLAWIGLDAKARLANIVPQSASGWLISLDDENDLREVMSKLASPAERQHLRENALRIARERFDLKEAIIPLDTYCRCPHFTGLKLDLPPPTPFYKLPFRALQIILSFGPRSFIEEIGQYFLWRYHTSRTKRTFS